MNEDSLIDLSKEDSLPVRVDTLFPDDSATVTPEPTPTLDTMAKPVIQVVEKKMPEKKSKVIIPAESEKQVVPAPEEPLADTLALEEESDLPAFAFAETEEVSAPNQTFQEFTKLPYAREGGFKNDWFIGLIFISFLLLVIVRVFYGRYLNMAGVSLFNYNVARKLFRNRNVLFRRSFAFLNLIFYLHMGMYVYLLLWTTQVELQGVEPVYIIGGVAFLFFLMYNVKWLVMHIVGYIFNKHELFEDYIDNVLLVNKNIGIYLYPFILAIPFASEYLREILVTGSLLLIGLLFLLRIVRGIQLILVRNTSFFYLILYLCTLEILPILLLYKFVIGNQHGLQTLFIQLLT